MWPPSIKASSPAAGYTHILETQSDEPLPAEHPLWTLPNVLLTPHIAVRGADNLPERRYQVLLENARRFAAGEPLRNVVDKAAWY